MIEDFLTFLSENPDTDRFPALMWSDLRMAVTNPLTYNSFRCKLQLQRSRFRPFRDYWNRKTSA